MVKKKLKEEIYSAFYKIDGRHSLQDECPHACITYQVKQLDKGNILFFNFPLAKEMGLIPKDHPNKVSKKLEKVLLETFNIQIINEYDRIKGKKNNINSVKQGQFMATRYLQIQHPSKLGWTSGDGRSIWNGRFKGKGTWDISSRGTGVTSLAPGSVQAQRPLETGNIDHGYGCGLAEIPELLESIIQSERFYNLGFNTERTLLIIDHGKGLGISVRAGKNLFRPAHFLLYLRQSNHLLLEKSFRWYLKEYEGFKEGQSNETTVYNEFFINQAVELGKMVALCDLLEVFIWIEWDGDNLLLDGGIIDYGSIRQFGAHHNEYQFDDIDRLSPPQKKQIHKAQELIKMLSQMKYFLKNKKKKNLSEFDNSIEVRKFKESYDRHWNLVFLKSLGFSQNKAKAALNWDKKSFNLLKDKFQKLRKLKDDSKRKKVSDGYNKAPRYNLNVLLVNLKELTEEIDEGLLQQICLKQILKKDLPLHHKKLLSLKNTILNFTKKHNVRYQYKGDFKDRLTGTALIMFVEYLNRQKDLDKVLISYSLGLDNLHNKFPKVLKKYQDLKEEFIHSL